MAERTDAAVPRARAEGVVVREVAEEVLVYDLDTHRAVCLNATAAAVWRLCDGRRAPADIRRALEKTAGGAVPEELVWLALEQLCRDRLLDARPPARPPALAGLSRREMMRRVGLAAALALPAVAAVVAPTPAQAASCLPTGAACAESGQCCNNLCSGGTCA
ncbi:MAG TPA: PqqD family protein [Pyrinomonadaceae bacterium]|jgi:hypothetical protein